jgi:hypothetical protein
MFEFESNSFIRTSKYARACAVSSAGMIPSSSETSWNAFRASSSVTACYSALPESFNQECSGPTPG